MQEVAAQGRLCRTRSIWCFAILQVGGLCPTKRYFLPVLTSSLCSNMENSLTTGYSSRVKIESRNNLLERYSSLGIPLIVTDSSNMLVDTCLRRPCMMGARLKRKDICCIRTGHNLILQRNLASLRLKMLINGYTVQCGDMRFE
jgi:hypothetical protein